MTYLSHRRNNIVRSNRRGFTLVEAMIAVTMTLLIMMALATAFKRLSDDISQGRARLALSDQLRGISEVLRNDLAGLTVSGDPSSKVSKSGYLLYYEGPLCDHTAVTAPINNKLSDPAAKLEENLSTSKYGDFDDILMFTARANGDWFKGRVPLALVKGPTGAPITVDDWVNTIVVASEYAEIAYFMLPMETVAGTEFPTIAYTTTAGLPFTPSFDDNDTAVNPSLNQFIVGTATDNLLPNGTGNAIPDRLALCRRVLLILPSLNVQTSPPPALFDNGPDSIRGGVYETDNLTQRTHMENAYQRCDLSVRRVPGNTAGPASVAANSLDDLTNPLNRFAHTVLRINNSNNTTLPFLSLTGPIALQRYALSGQSIDISGSASGFLPSNFLRRRFFNNGGAVQSGGVTGAEILATNCVAFDLKGFDPSVRLLYHRGVDGVDSSAGVAISSLGASGSDDVVVSPSDPGYGTSVGYITANTATLAQATASQGAFVDIGWALKNPLTRSTARTDVFSTNLSLVNASNNYTAAFQKSGKVAVLGSLFAVFQPSYDSYTDAFEHDGYEQSASGGNGTVFTRGMEWLQGGTPPYGATADRGVNGIDDDMGSGLDGQIDDDTEKDSSPPIAAVMPAIQAFIRLEDARAGVIQQIAVTQDLVTQ